MRAASQKKWRVELLKADPPKRPGEQSDVPEPPESEDDGNARKIPDGRRKYQQQLAAQLNVGLPIDPHVGGDVEAACAQVLEGTRLSVQRT